MTPTTTCQICGRAILANTGLIAYHGYRRPLGWHAQTRSCFGARFVSYEVGHDALDAYIPKIEEWLTDAEARRVAPRDDPPATISVTKTIGWNTGTQVFDRPAGFVAANHFEVGSYNPR